MLCTMILRSVDKINSTICRPELDDAGWVYHGLHAYAYYYARAGVHVVLRVTQKVVFWTISDFTNYAVTIYDIPHMLFFDVRKIR